MCQAVTHVWPLTVKAQWCCKSNFCQRGWLQDRFTFRRFGDNRREVINRCLKSFTKGNQFQLCALTASQRRVGSSTSRCSGKDHRKGSSGRITDRTRETAEIEPRYKGNMSNNPSEQVNKIPLLVRFGNVKRIFVLWAFV